MWCRLPRSKAPGKNESYEMSALFGMFGDQGLLKSASWLFVALGGGLLLIWSLRRFGRLSGSRRADAASVTGGLVALAVGLAGVSPAAVVASPAGTRWYHAHFDELNQQGGGLTGALVIEPRDPPSTKADREYTLLTGEWMTAAGNQARSAVPTPSVTRGMGGGMMGNGGGM